MCIVNTNDLCKVHYFNFITTHSLLIHDYSTSNPWGIYTETRNTSPAYKYLDVPFLKITGFNDWDGLGKAMTTLGSPLTNWLFPESDERHNRFYQRFRYVNGVLISRKMVGTLNLLLKQDELSKINQVDVKYNRHTEGFKLH